MDEMDYRLWERQFDQQERLIVALNRLAAATEVQAGYRVKPLVSGKAPEVVDKVVAAPPVGEVIP